MHANDETYIFARAISGNHDNNWVAESFEAAVERIICEKTAPMLQEIADLKQRITNFEDGYFVGQLK